MEPLIFHYLTTILSLSGIVLVALISPGPDFAIVVRNSLVYSRKTALLTAFGISLGVLIHVSYTLLGLGFLITKNPWVLLSVKYLGAGYLLYIGWKGLKAKNTNLALGNTQNIRDISTMAAIRSGFFTSAFNPKAILFFVSLFSVFLDFKTPPFIMFIYGIIIFIETLCWFSFVAFCLSGKRTRNKFNAFGHWVERFTGGILIMLGAKLFFTV